MVEENNNAPDIDVEKISQLLKIRPHIYVKLISSFADNLDEKLKLFTTALAANDKEQMRVILHEIKGTAGNLRLHNITGPESLLHTGVKAGENQAVLLKHFDVLKSEVTKLHQIVDRLKQKDYSA